MEYQFAFKDKTSYTNVIRYNSKNTNPCLIQGFVYMYDKKIFRYFNKLLSLIKDNSINMHELLDIFMIFKNNSNFRYHLDNITFDINKSFKKNKQHIPIDISYKDLPYIKDLYSLTKNIYELYKYKLAKEFEKVIIIKDIQYIKDPIMLSSNILNLNDVAQYNKNLNHIRNFIHEEDYILLNNIRNFNAMMHFNKLYSLSYQTNLTKMDYHKMLSKIFNLKITNYDTMIHKQDFYKIYNINNLSTPLDDDIKNIYLNNNIALKTNPTNVLLHNLIQSSIGKKYIYMENNISFMYKNFSEIFTSSNSQVSKQIFIGTINSSFNVYKGKISNNIHVFRPVHFSSNISEINIFKNIFAAKNGASLYINNFFEGCKSVKSGNININKLIYLSVSENEFTEFEFIPVREIYDNKALSLYNKTYQMTNLDNIRNIMTKDAKKWLIKKQKVFNELISSLVNISSKLGNRIDFQKLFIYCSKRDKALNTIKLLLHMSNVKRECDVVDTFTKLINIEKPVMLETLGLCSMYTTEKPIGILDTITNALSVPKYIYIKNSIKFLLKKYKPICIDDKMINVLFKAKPVWTNNIVWYRKKKRAFSKKNIFSTMLLHLEKLNKPIRLDNTKIPLYSTIKDFIIDDTTIKLSETLKQVLIEEAKMLEISETLKDIYSTNIEFLTNTINNIFTAESPVNLSNNNRDVWSDHKMVLWEKVLKDMAELPYAKELFDDKIAKDVIMWDYGVGVVTDEFIMEQGLGVDELLLPHNDFDYSSLKTEIFDYKKGRPINPIKRIDETTFIAKYPVNHAFDTGKEIGREYLDLNVGVLKHMIDVYYQTWQEHIFEFGTMDLRGGLEKMLKYLQIYIEYRIPYSIREHAERCFQLFRWYSENIAMRNSKYKIHFTYKPWKSNLYEGGMSCPHTLRNVIINSKYVFINTKNNCEITLQQEAKKEGFLQFDAMITEGSLDVYINGVNSYNLISNKRVQIPIEKGKLDIRFVFNGKSMKLGNIVIDNCEFDDIVTEYEFDPGSANLGMDKVTKNICNYFMITQENFDDIKQGIQGALSLRDVTNRLIDYYDKHHRDKTKGKRLTIKKEML